MSDDTEWVEIEVDVPDLTEELMDTAVAVFHETGADGIVSVARLTNRVTFTIRPGDAASAWATLHAINTLYAARE